MALPTQPGPTPSLSIRSDPTRMTFRKVFSETPPESFLNLRAMLTGDKPGRRTFLFVPSATARRARRILQGWNGATLLLFRALLAGTEPGCPVGRVQERPEQTLLCKPDKGKRNPPLAEPDSAWTPSGNPPPSPQAARCSEERKGLRRPNNLPHGARVATQVPVGADMGTRL